MNERKLTKSELAKREDIIMKMKKNKRSLVQKYGKDAEAVMYGRATKLAKKQAESMDQDKIKELVKDALQNPKAADLNKDGKLSDYEKKRGAAIEKSMTNEGTLTENKQEAFDELQMIMDQLYELSDQAKMIFRNNFPGEYSRLDAYGALDFGTSSNRYDVTLEGTLENLDMEDDDEDLMEGKDSTHKVKYSKSNNTYQVWLGDEIVTDFATEEKANAEAKRLNALQDAKRIDKAQVGEDLDLGHEDNEPHMLKGDLYRIGKYAMELYQILDQFEAGSEEVDLPHWWQSKIIKSKDAIVGAKHYLDFEIKEPQIDAMVDVAQDVEAINEFDDESMTAYQKAVKKVYRPKYDGSIQMPSQEVVDAFFKKIGQEDHHLANKPVFGDIEPWDVHDYSDWKNITRGHKLNEGVWSLGSAKSIKNIIGILDMALDIKDPQELMDLMDMHDKSMYNIVGDDAFHDDIDGAKRELAQNNLDRAYNRLIDAKGRAKDLLKMVADRESARPYKTDIFNEVASKLAKQLKSK